MPGYAYGILFGGLALTVIITLLVILPFKLWFRALISHAHISMGALIGMQLRKTNVSIVVNTYIMAKKAGVAVKAAALETHMMSGGNIEQVVAALIHAQNAKIPLSIETAKAIDLAGRDVLSAIQNNVKPRIIETPQIAAVAKDGIELIVKVRVTVRTNISRLVGGADQDTIIARVGEGIVTAIGSVSSYKDVLQSPDIISKTVQLKGLDTATAFEILSIDIADIDVGDNIGAKLRTANAEAEKKIAQAKAEEKRAMAIAVEQEMRAKTQEMKANMLLAESEVPKAMAQAFKSGNIGIMDYYRMQNVVADTKMRTALSDDEGEDEAPAGRRGGGFGGPRPF